MTTLNINFVTGCQATEMMPVEMTWVELHAVLTKIDRKGKMILSDYLIAPDKMKKEDKDGTAWIPCSTIDPAGKRTQENMYEAYCVVLDIDSGMEFDDVKSRIEGFEAVIHSSYSHSPEKPKWRVILPLAQPIPAKEVGKVFDSFQERFDGQLDPVCGHDSAHLYYTPACPADAEPLFQYEHLEGKFLDGQAILMEATVKTPKSSKVSAGVAKIVPSLSSIHAGVSKGGRNSTAFKFSADLLDNEMDIDEVTKIVLSWNEKNDPPLEEVEIHQVIKSAMKNVTSKAAAAGAKNDVVMSDLNEIVAWVKKQRRIYRFKYRDFITKEDFNVGLVILFRCRW